MADTPIKHNELIEDNVFQPTADSADILLEKLSLLIGGFKELAKITGAKINAGIDPKTIGDVDKLAEAKQKLSNIEKGLTEVEKLQVQTKEKIRQARIQEIDQLKAQDGILGQLIIKKKELQKGLLSASTTEEVKRINQELFKTNGQIANIKQDGVKAFNSWGNALQSFQFKFNALGSTIGNVLGNFASGALSGGIGFLTSGLSFLADSFTNLIFPVQRSSDEIQEQTDRINNLIKSISELTETQKIRMELLGQDISDVDDLKKKENELNAEIQEQVDKINERIDAEQKQRQIRAGGLNDLKRELEIIKVNSENKKGIAKKEKQIRELELADLLERQKLLGQFALGDIDLQQQILDKRNEILVAQAKINKALQDEANENWQKQLKILDDAIKKAIDLYGKDSKAFIKAQEDKNKARDEFFKKQEDLILGNAEIESKLTKTKVDDENARFQSELINLERQFNAEDKKTEAFKKRMELIEKQHQKNISDIAKEERDKRFKEELDAANKLNDGIFKGLEQRSEKEKQVNADKLTELDKQISFQQQLALNGEKNTLGELEKERAKALEEKRAIEKRSARAKEAEQLAEIFLEFMKVYAGDKNNLAAAGKAAAATLGAKLIAKSIAGAFAGGVEDFKGKGTGTSDSNLIAFSSGESVLTAKGTKETSGLASAVNERGYIGAKEWAMENVFPKVPMLQDVSKSEQVMSAMLKTLHSDNKALIDVIKNKTEWTISENLFGEIVKARKQNGINSVTTVKNTPIINGK